MGWGMISVFSPSTPSDGHAHLSSHLCSCDNDMINSGSTYVIGQI